MAGLIIVRPLSYHTPNDGHHASAFYSRMAARKPDDFRNEDTAFGMDFDPVDLADAAPRGNGTTAASKWDPTPLCGALRRCVPHMVGLPWQCWPTRLLSSTATTTGLWPTTLCTPSSSQSTSCCALGFPSRAFRVPRCWRVSRITQNQTSFGTTRICEVFTWLRVLHSGAPANVQWDESGRELRG